MKPHERLRTVRETLGLTQTELAKKIKMAVSSLSSAETGANGVTPRVLFPLKVMYRVNENWILKGEGEMFYEKPSVDGLPGYILDNPRATEEYIIMLQREVVELKEEKERYKKIVDRLMS